MAMTIQTNNAAITALKHLNTNTTNMNKSLERLSSGYRINSAADDAAGYAISAKLSGQNARMMAATQNTASATAMVKMADAAVNEIQNMVVRVQSLATQAASANNAAEISKLEAERAKLETQIDKIANGTNYGGVNLLNGVQTAGTLTTLGTPATGFTATKLSAPLTSIVSVNGIYENAQFTINEIGTAYSSVKSNLDLKDANGNLIAAAGTELLLGGAQVTITPNGTNTTINLVGGGSIVVNDQPIAGADFSTVNTTGATPWVAGTQVNYTAPLDFQVGADNSASNRVAVDLRNTYTATGLGLSGGATAVFTNQASAQAYIDTAQTALNQLVNQRADLGATQNQLTYVTANLGTGIEQVSSAISSVKDADMATEMASFTKNQIMVQAGTAMLAQANQASQNIMSLFR